VPLARRAACRRGVKSAFVNAVVSEAGGTGAVTEVAAVGAVGAVGVVCAGAPLGAELPHDIGTSTATVTAPAARRFFFTFGDSLFQGRTAHRP
jgi:hypothetical protein